MFGEPSELYHLKDDPREYRNLFGDPGFDAVVDRLDGRLDDFFLRHADERYDPWRGGTGKAILMYTDRNEQFEAGFPNWQKPVTEKLPPFSDRRQGSAR
jgi:hypothetical protein